MASEECFKSHDVVELPCLHRASASPSPVTMVTLVTMVTVPGEALSNKLQCLGISKINVVLQLCICLKEDKISDAMKQSANIYFSLISIILWVHQNIHEAKTVETNHAAVPDHVMVIP